jgi:hypothetical protein
MNGISHQMMTLINTMLENYDRWEVHSFKLDDMHRLTYGDATITNWTDDKWLVEYKTCDSCSGAHIACKEFEILTDDPIEALELASANGYAK